ncbi:MAG: hypothetical protein ABIZ49_02980 [Opitutaceae bacterium]
MKIRPLVFLFALIAGLAAPGALNAAEEHKHDSATEHSGKAAKGELVKVDAKTDATWLAKAKAAYPTDVCVVSNDKLGGDMGLPQDYVYREAGKPDRLVRFCCKDCLKDFNADAAKYLGMIDTAAAKKTGK